MYYLGKLTYQQEDENGRLKTISELYLIDALSFTEAEARLHTEAVSNVSPTVKSIRPIKVSDIYRHDDARDPVWYEARLLWYSINERTGKEKKITDVVYVETDAAIDEANIGSVIERLGKELARSLVTIQIDQVRRTDILDILQPAEAPEPIQNS